MEFKVMELKINMRLENLRLSIERRFGTQPEQHTAEYIEAIADLKLQTNYGDVIVAIGEAQNHVQCSIANDNKYDCTQIRHICDSTISTILQDPHIEDNAIQQEILDFMSSRF
jgi:hypothetical protein